MGSARGRTSRDGSFVLTTTVPGPVWLHVDEAALEGRIPGRPCVESDDSWEPLANGGTAAERRITVTLRATARLRCGYCSCD